MSELMQALNDLMNQVPGLVQPLVVALAAAIPFVEGEGAATLGVLAGVNPVVAALSAMMGNFLSVAVVVLLGSRARSAVVDRSSRAPKPRSKGRQKFDRVFVRFGVPGVSLLGPLILPTQLTAAALVTAGVSKRRVLVWQAAAIVLWTSAFTAIATGLISLV